MKERRVPQALTVIAGLALGASLAVMTPSAIAKTARADNAELFGELCLETKGKLADVGAAARPLGFRELPAKAEDFRQAIMRQFSRVLAYSEPEKMDVRTFDKTVNVPSELFLAAMSVDGRRKASGRHIDYCLLISNGEEEDGNVANYTSAVAKLVDDRIVEQVSVHERLFLEHGQVTWKWSSPPNSGGPVQSNVLKYEYTRGDGKLGWVLSLAVLPDIP